MADLSGIILTNASRLRELHTRLHEAFRKEPHGAAHHAACEAFHEQYDRLAVPGGLDRWTERLRVLDPEAVELGIRYLEADPWCYRSGYVKEEALRRLKHAALTPEQVQRLTELVLRSLTSGTGRVFRHYRRIAKVLDVRRISFVAEAHRKDANPVVQDRARSLFLALSEWRALPEGERTGLPKAAEGVSAESEPPTVDHRPRAAFGIGPAGASHH